MWVRSLNTVCFVMSWPEFYDGPIIRNSKTHLATPPHSDFASWTVGFAHPMIQINALFQQPVNSFCSLNRAKRAYAPLQGCCSAYRVSPFVVNRAQKVCTGYTCSILFSLFRKGEMNFVCCSYPVPSLLIVPLLTPPPVIALLRSWLAPASRHYHRWITSACRVHSILHIFRRTLNSFSSSPAPAPAWWGWRNHGCREVHSYVQF